jgi:protein TonB
VVQLAIRFRGHEIVEVKQLSGPREYFRDINRAVRRLDCKVPAGTEVTATLEIAFREQ